MFAEQCIRVQPWDGGGDAAEAVFSDAVLLFRNTNAVFEQNWHVFCLAVEIFVRALVDVKEQKYVLWPKKRVWQLCAAAYTLAIKQACNGNYNCTLSIVTEVVFGPSQLRKMCSEVAKVECWLFAHLDCCVPLLSDVAVAIDRHNNCDTERQKLDHARRHYSDILGALPSPTFMLVATPKISLA